MVEHEGNKNEGDICCSAHCMSSLVGIISMDMMCTYFLKHCEKMHSRAGRQKNEGEIRDSVYCMFLFIGLKSIAMMCTYTLNHSGKVNGRARRQIDEGDICGSIHCKNVFIVHLRPKALREYAWLGRRANK